MVREFLGKDDPDAVIVENVFVNSDVVVSHGIFLSKDVNGIAIQGCDDHLDLLAQRLALLLCKRRRTFGRWTGLFWNEKKHWLSLYYVYTQFPCFEDLFILLSTKLRVDAAAICQIKLREKALLTVVREGEAVFKTDINLPEGLEQNGEFILPDAPLIIQPEAVPLH